MRSNSYRFSFRRNPFPYRGGKDLGVVAGGGGMSEEKWPRHVRLVLTPRGPASRDRVTEGTGLV